MQRLHPAEAVDDLLQPYRACERKRADRAWVMANMVCGLDGSAAVRGRVGELSAGADMALFRLMRSLADVVLVGAETVRRERYGPVHLAEDLQQRRIAAGRAALPQIAVVSRSLEIDWSLPMFERGAGPTPLVLTCGAAEAAQISRASRVAEVVLAGDERVDVTAAVSELSRRDGEVILCEGGPNLLGQLVAAELLDELCLTIAPVMGGDPLPVAVAPSGAGLSRFDLSFVLRDDSNLFLRYENRRAS